jgi:hypothetical protein
LFTIQQAVRCVIYTVKSKVIRRNTGLFLVIFLFLRRGSLGGFVELSRISGLLSGVAAEDGKAGLLGDASARNGGTHAVGDLARDEARINLQLAAHATPAHSIVVIVTALDGASSALVVEQDAPEPLQR